MLAPEDKTFATHDWSAFGERLQPLYCGGESRRDSVYNGLVAAMNDIQADDWLLVHDAARPCLPEKDLDKLTRLFITCNPDRMLWGSDWPHPQPGVRPLPQDVCPPFEVDQRQVLASMAAWSGSASTFKRILVDNPHRLYGFAR